MVFVEATQRVREGLAELIRLANDPTTPTSDLRAMLAECKAFGGRLAVLQADAAAGVASRERHGDSGVGLLVQTAGLSRWEAARQVKTAQRLESLPAVRDAVETGQVSIANAKALADACDKTSAEQVDQDSELLAKAGELSPEQFVREAGRWAARRQPDDGEALHRRQRARRRLSIWNGDDGMVHLRGELDPVTGAKVHKRFLQESERLRRVDLHSPGGEKRGLNQRMADALDTLTSHGSIYAKSDSGPHNGRSRANDRERLPNGDAGLAGDGVGAGDGDRLGLRTGGVGLAGVGVGAGDGDRVGLRTGGAGPADGAGEGRGSGAGSGGGARSKCVCGGRPSADITIVQHLSADGTDAFAEVAGGDVIPQSVLEEHFCNARIKGVVFSREGVPLWHGHTKRVATKAQMSALRARYGGCGGCGADMWICQGHHIKPVSQGGPTNIDNMMLLCWACHQKVHHHGWRVAPDGRGLHTVAPPERIRYGPAHAPDPPPTDRPRRSRGSTRRARTPHARPAADRANQTRNPSARAQPEPLFGA